MTKKRLAITGMGINTPLGDTPGQYLDGLLAGKSAVTSWKSVNTDNIYGKVGGDMGGYDMAAKLEHYKQKIPETIYEKVRWFSKKSPWTMGISLQVAVDAFLDSGLFEHMRLNEDIATVVAGHNLNQKYTFENHNMFNEEPDFIDGLFSLYGLDTNHVGILSDVLQLKGPGYTVGGACASGNIALKSAYDEVVFRNAPAALVLAPILDLSPLDIQGMAVMDAITYQSFNDTPEKASRPYDLNREGFVPSHGAAAMVVEDLEHAQARGAVIHAEIVDVEASADGSHLPKPSQEGQARLMKRMLKRNNIAVEEIDYINAHATSTPLGDLTEIRSIKEVFGQHAYKLKINAPKSMLGHTCWSAALVETVAAVLQMNHGELHPSINIEQIDPEVDLDVCRDKKVKHPVKMMMKNSFGFGGLNSISLIKKYEG